MIVTLSGGSRVPPAPETVSVKVVVTVGQTTTDPPGDTGPTPWSIVAVVAPVVVQLRLEHPPRVIWGGSAWKVPVGAGGGGAGGGAGGAGVTGAGICGVVGTSQPEAASAASATAAGRSREAPVGSHPYQRYSPRLMVIDTGPAIWPARTVTGAVWSASRTFLSAKDHLPGCAVGLVIERASRE